ncbi:MAG: hypothetical protein M1830_001970 [Pleopsidium flavum]|nr:MAG: hypothetical protein M1830_001970 [Pleopsidium flavum]
MNPADHQAASNDELLKKFNEESSRQAAEYVKKMRILKETPVEHDRVQQLAGTPRLSVTISGPPTLSLSERTYVLDAQLHYHSESKNQPISIRNGGVPGSGWNDDELYLFYRADGKSVADGVAVEHEFPEKNIDDDEVPVGAENGFSTIGVGETISRRVQIWLRWWSGLEVGGKYKLLMPHGYIGWWDYGPLEVCRILRCRSERARWILTIPLSTGSQGS